MRKRYRMKDGKLELMGEVRQAPYESNTFAVGDIPDMLKDQALAKKRFSQQQKAERLQTIINAVNKYGIS